MLVRRVGMGIAVLLGCWIVFGAALPPAGAVDQTRPAAKDAPPSPTSNPAGCSQFCRTTPVKSCHTGKTCQNVEPKLHSNGFCECLCRDRCDGGRMPKR